MKLLFGTIAVSLSLIACGDETPSLDPERPPVSGGSEMEAWLEAGLYLQWACETEPHDARAGSPHQRNRICSNAVLSGHGAGEYPIDSASVKEIYQGSSIAGFAVYRKVAAGQTGDAFYWYERVGDTTAADGIGSAGRGTAACISCHMGAGIDAEHSGHDFVYTQVR